MDDPYVPKMIESDFKGQIRTKKCKRKILFEYHY